MKRALLLAVALTACPQSQDGPEPVFRRFVASVQSGEVEKAWSLLSKGTQVALEAYVEKQRELGVNLPADPHRAVLGNAELARPIESMSLKSEAADRAVLTVTSGGVARDVTLVKEQGAWRIAFVLPDS